MPNPYFQFKQFTMHHDRCAMKVTTDACLFGGWVAEEMQNAKCKIENVLDIGTGTGLLSMMVAQRHSFPIDAVEIDEAASDQAKENVQASGFKNIQMVHSDILQLEPKSYDCIFSNPPFYEAELSSPDAKRKAAHHGSGLRWEDLFSIIRQRLTLHGVFYLLLPHKRLNELDALLNSNGLCANKIIHVKPSTTHAPTRLLLSGSFAATSFITSELSIKDSTGSYTPDFVALLKDYYLYL